MPRPATRLRKEEAQKARELVPLLRELSAALARSAAGRELLLVDAAAGRGYVAFLSTRLVLGPSGRRFRWVLIEREAGRVRACRELARREGLEASVEVRCADVEAAAAWPAAPDLVVALHACGRAADAVIDRACAVGARDLLVVPCCVSKSVAGHAGALAAAEALGIPTQAPVRRRFLEAMIAAERTLRLEARGWQTQVVELCPQSVTPHNLVWRCHRVGDLTRMRRAREELERLGARPR